jgi:ribulose-5-phosphate 4-epimerase/fuculose-1-phosphate aldolase
MGKKDSLMAIPANWQDARERVVLFAQRMLRDGLTCFTAGNISVRIEGDSELVAMTPGSLPYDTMRPEDVVIANVAGQVVHGLRSPTSEFPLHTIVYEQRPDIGAVVHTHSSAGMAMAAAGLSLPPILHGFVAACGGGIITAPYAKGGTDEIPVFTAAALRDRSACFLRNHGVLAVGPTLEHAYNAAAQVECASRAYLLARAFGPVPEIPPDDVARLRRDLWMPAWTDGSSAPTHGG